MGWTKDKNGEWNFEFEWLKGQAGQEVLSWWADEDQDFHQMILDILASLPGGDLAEELGGKQLNLGWKEVDMIGELISAIQAKDDVEEMCEALMGPPDEEEEGQERVELERGE